MRKLVAGLLAGGILALCFSAVHAREPRPFREDQIWNKRVLLASRNSAGTYSLVSGNPVVSGTTITTAWANNTLSDLATEITNSLDRNGRGAMLAPLQLSNGSVTAPSLTFGSEAGSGIYRAGAGDVRMSVTQGDVMEWLAAGVMLNVATFDRMTAAALNIGTTNATTITIGRTGQTVAHPGDVTVTGTLSSDNLTVSHTAASANININAATATNQANLNLQDQGVTKYQVLKQTDNTFLLWDAANAHSFLTYTPGATGTVTLSSSNLSVPGTLGVTGAATLSSTLAVTSTTALSDLLTVQKASAAQVAELNLVVTGASSVGDGAALSFLHSSGERGYRIYERAIASSRGELRFASGNASAGYDDRVTLDQNGNVGIGVTTPSVTGGGGLQLQPTGSGGNVGVSLKQTATGGRTFEFISTNANPGAFTLYDVAGGDRLTISSTGLVTVPGAFVASSTADVAGNFNVNTNKFQVVAASGNTTAAGTLTVSTASAGLLTQEAWTAVTFANSWVNFGAPNLSAGYMKDSQGFVHLRGLIKDGTVAATIFTLAAGYRPSAKAGYGVISNGALGYVTVESNGNVTLASGSNAWAYLDGITFDTR